MLRDFEGKRLRAHRLTLPQVKRQFDKAGHNFKGIRQSTIDGDGIFTCLCECGAKLRFRRDGSKFSQLEVFERPLGT